MRLKVKAGARRDALLGPHSGALKITVTTAPEKGKANKAVVRLLANRLSLAPSSIELISGHTSQDKTVLVPLSATELTRRLGQSAESSD